jgi:hypothetical protein
MSGKLLQRASFYYNKDDKMVDYFPTDETVGAFAETARSTFLRGLCGTVRSYILVPDLQVL